MLTKQKEKIYVKKVLSNCVNKSLDM